MYKTLGIVAGICVDNEWWCISRKIDGLYKLDIHTGNISHICELPEKNQIDKQAYTDIISYKNKLIFIPAFAKNVAIYDIEKEKLDMIEIFDYLRGCEGIGIGGGVVYKDWLVLYPCLADVFIRINLNTNEIKVSKSVREMVGIDLEIFSYHKRHFQENNELYIPMAGYDAVFTVDIENFEFSIINIPNGESGFSGIIKIENELWLSPVKEAAIVKYNIENSEIKRYNSYPKFFKRNKTLAFSGLIDLGEYICILPFAANMFLKINKSTGTMDELVIHYEMPWYTAVLEDVTLINIHSFIYVDGKCFMFSELLNEIIMITKDNDILELPLIFEGSDNVISQCIDVNEARHFRLSEYLKCL